MTKGILFFDIDGTLVDSGNGDIMPFPEVMEAMERAKKNGYKCVIASGRNLSGLAPYRHIGMDGFVSSDGACILVEGQEPVHYPIPKKIVVDLIAQVTEEFHGNILLSWDGGAFATEKEFELMYENFERMQGEDKEKLMELFNLKHIDEWTDEEILEVDVSFPDTKTEKAWVKVKNPDLHFISTTASYGRGEATSGEITYSGITKAAGCREICELLKVDFADTYAFGDSMNDASMIEECGVGIAMGNAAEELKKRADYVTDDIREHGLVNAMDHFDII